MGGTGPAGPDGNCLWDGPGACDGKAARQGRRGGRKQGDKRKKNKQSGGGGSRFNSLVAEVFDFDTKNSVQPISSSQSSSGVQGIFATGLAGDDFVPSFGDASSSGRGGGSSRA